MLCGGLAFVIVVFLLVAGVDFASAPLAMLLAILFAAYFVFTVRRFARSEQIGNPGGVTGSVEVSNYSGDQVLVARSHNGCYRARARLDQAAPDGLI